MLSPQFSCRRKEYSIEKVEVDNIPTGDSPFALQPPDQPDIIAGTTVIVVFYAGTM